MTISLEQAHAAKASAKLELAGITGVVGIGLTKVGDDYAVKVNLSAALPPGVRLPDRIGGVPVRVEIVGVVRKQGS
jgi:hypothetical protein